MHRAPTPPHDAASRSRWGLEDLPPEPVEWRPEPRAVQRVLRAVSTPVVAGVIVFVAVALAAVATVWIRPHEPVLDHSEGTVNGQWQSSEVAGDVEGTEVPLLGSAPLHSAAGQKVFVHVVGEVVRPGVVELDSGSRVAAAIDAAGGATETAVLSGVNLARVLGDGEQILVPNADQAAHNQGNNTGPAGSTSGGRVNLNTADLAALESLPQVGPSLAQRIVDWRQANGGFSSAEQLLDVSGIGHKTFERLSQLVTV